LKLGIRYWMDPWFQTSGGIESYSLSLIKNVPSGTSIELIGVTSDTESRPSKTWYCDVIGNTRIRFLPLFHVRDPNRRAAFPLSIRYWLALFLTPQESGPDVVICNRPEACFASPKNSKLVLIVHTGLEVGQSVTTDFRWSRFSCLYWV
jgi:hypothetical protein